LDTFLRPATVSWKREFFFEILVASARRTAATGRLSSVPATLVPTTTECGKIGVRKVAW